MFTFISILCAMICSLLTIRNVQLFLEHPDRLRALLLAISTAGYIASLGLTYSTV